MPDTRKAILIRVNPALADAVSRLAERELRSVNAQIEFLIREGLGRRGVKISEPTRPSGGTAVEPPGAAEPRTPDGTDQPDG